MYKHFWTLLIASSMLPATLPAAAQEEVEEEQTLEDSAIECINIRNFRRFIVVDDKTILFYLRGSTVYLNILPRQCNGLAREDRFSYEARMNRLCRNDTITVLYATGGGPYGVTPGPGCSLGYFQKVTREDAASIREASKAQPMAEPLPMPEPEAPGEDEESEEDVP
jgi:hypothetical protein